MKNFEDQDVYRDVNLTPPPPLLSPAPKEESLFGLSAETQKKKTEMCFSAKEEEELRTANPTQMCIAEAQRVMP
jgi:hypothetical protein